ncbi:MAG: hypothetical protein P4L84_03965 [Isosphaeraceae bacterium]|nr:hypothetical protein [Isosphaeraceae bacterium]
MQGRERDLWVVVLLVVGSFFVGLAKTAAPTGAAPQRTSLVQAAPAEPREAPERVGEQAKGSDKEPPAHRLDTLKPVVDYLALDEKYHGRSARSIARDLRRLDVEFLIATAPDPIDSRFGYNFDSTLDAIEMAVESQGFVLDRYWLPWWPSGKQPGRGDLVREDTLDPNGQASPMLHEREPGVLLFRNKGVTSRDEQRLLMILVVGESPTWGIHKIAFVSALNIIKNYERFFDETHPIHIVGPFFSGSANSMALAISGWATQQSNPSDRIRRFLINTGSATMVDQEHFREAAKPADATISATVISDRLVVPWLLNYLRKKNAGRWPSKIAILTESDTSYGKLIEDIYSDQLHGEDSADKLAAPKLVNMKFPSRISQLRSAFERNRTQHDPEVPILPRPRSKLRVPFDETGNPRDIIPALSPAMTATTDEFLLAKILTTISHDDFRYVGIFGSDIRDTLFLAQLVTEFCPDVQMFTNTCDVLLAHPDYSGRLRGMIVASTYPLNSSTQPWTFPFTGDGERRQFHQQGDQGVYNATLAHFLSDATEHSLGDGLRTWRKLLDYGVPTRALVSGDAQDLLALAEGEHRPPLWIGVVGQRGIWPVEYLVPQGPNGAKLYEQYLKPVRVEGAERTEGASADHRQRTFEAERRLLQFIPRYTWTWGTAFMVCSAFIWSVLWALSRLIQERLQGHDGRPVPGRTESGFRTLVEVLRPTRIAGLSTKQAWYFGMAVVTVAVLYWYIASPSLVPAFFSAWSFPLWRRLSSADDFLNWVFILSAPFISCATVVALGVVVWARCILGCARRANSIEPLASRLTWTLVLSLLASLAVVVLWLCWYWLSWREYTAEQVRQKVAGLLDFERTVHLSNGVSRVTPALCLGLVSLCWFYCQLKRIYLIDRLRTGGPFDGSPEQPPHSVGDLWAGVGEAGSILGRIRRRATKIDELLHGWHSVKGAYPAFLLLGGLVLFAVLRLIQKFVPTIDGPWYTGIMLVFFVLFSLAVLFTFARFLLLWKHLRKMFREIAQFPVLQAYDRLPASFSRTYGRYLDQYEPRFSNLAFSVQQWARVAQGFDSARMDIRTQLFGDTHTQLTVPERALLDQIAINIKLTPDGTGTDAADRIKALFDGEMATGGDFGDVAQAPIRLGLISAAAACLRVLVPSWRFMPLQQAYADAPLNRDVKASPAATPQAQAAPTATSPGPSWRKAAEELVALEVVNYVSQFTIHMRNLATFLTVGPLLLLFTITSYPFQPARLLMVLVGGMAFIVVFFIIYVYVQLDRDTFLSRVSLTLPNRVTLDRTFLATILPTILPLVGIAITQFPDLSDAIDSIFEPIFRLLR